MNIKHLHLHVRDRSAAEAFYREWFGLTVARRGKVLTFLNDHDAFDLALMEDATPAPMPSWFHFGFRLHSAQEVVALHRRMSESGLDIRKPLYQDDTLASFRCADPDGYAIEIFWESDDAPLG